MQAARSTLVILLLTLGVVSALGANVIVWANRTVFKEDSFVSTTNRVLDDKQTQQQLATRLSATLIDQGQVEQRLRDQLPQGLHALAPVLATAAQGRAYDIILRLFQSNAVRAALDDALRLVHSQVMRVVDGKGAVVVADNDVVIDFKVVLQQAAQQLNLDPNITLKLPPDAGQIVLVHNAKNAGAVQRLLSHHNTIAWAMVGVAVLMFCLAVLVARNRRATLRTSGILLIACGLLAVALLILLRPIISRLAENPSAARSAFDAFFLGYRFQSLLLMLIGAVVLIAGALAGEGDVARAVRQSVRRPAGEPAPDMRAAISDNATSFRVIGFLAAAIALVVWPQPGNRVYVTTFVLLALYLAGLWVVASESAWAAKCREQLAAAWQRAAAVPAPGGKATFPARYARHLRLAGIAAAVVVAIVIPDAGIGAIAGIVALTLIYLAAIDWLARRPT